jgi:methyl-accepting chemotaxis protein
MNLLNNMKIGTRLVLNLGVVLVLMIIMIVVGLGSLQRVHSRLEEISMVEDVRIRQANIMIDDARQTALAVRDFLLANHMNQSSQQIQAYIDTLGDKRNEYQDALARYKQVAQQVDEKQLELLNATESAAETAKNNQDHAITLVLAGDVNAGTDFMFSTAYPSVRIWIANLDSLIKYEEARSLAHFQEAQTAYANTRAFILWLGIAAVVLSAFISYLLTISITRPLAQVTKMITSRDLTLDVSMDLKRKDEAGVMIRSFSEMVGMIGSQMQAIRDSVNALGSSASEILAATTQVASSTAESATSISETTTTVEEVRQAAQLSSEKAKYVSENAQRVTLVSQSGQNAAEETLAGMERIREQMESIAQTVVRLSEQSQSIGGIIASVTDLADQSNLLAVNAAIEAAKAGEQGRGFAVVAQEIRSLAEQSKQATAQVRAILNDVQRATNNTVLATEQGSKAVEAGVRQAVQAGDAIRAMAEASDTAVQAALQIVASGQQQVVGMDQISVAMENINQAGAQNAISMRQMEVAAAGLNVLGQKLKELTTQFKV